LSHVGVGGVYWAEEKGRGGGQWSGGEQSEGEKGEKGGGGRGLGEGKGKECRDEERRG